MSEKSEVGSPKRAAGRQLGRVAAVVAGLLFLALTLMISVDRLPGIDRYVMTRLPLWNREQVKPLAEFITLFGSLGLVTLLSLPLLVWLTRTRPKDARLFLLAFVASPLSSLFKGLVGRTRPEAWLLGFEPAYRNDLSFPSGHAALSAAVYGFFIMLVWSLPVSAWVRWAVTPAMSMLILGVAWSRVYLGVHYPTDVLGGMALGIGWLGVVGWLESYTLKSRSN